MSTTSNPSIGERRVPKWITALSMVLVLTVVLSSFALSFTVLRDLAAQSGIPKEVAWLWPVIVDGTITAATVVLYSARGQGRSSKLPMATLVLFGLASVVGNVAHILMIDARLVPTTIAVFVGITPPIGLIMTVELMAGLLRSGRDAESTGAHDEPVDGPPPGRPVHEPQAELVHVGSDADQTVTHREQATPLGQPHEPVAEPEPAVVQADSDQLIQPEPAGAEPSNEVPAGDAESSVQQREPNVVEMPAEAPAGADKPDVTLIDADEAGHSDEPEVSASAQLPAPQRDVAPQAAKSAQGQAEVVDQARQLIDEGLSQRATAEQLGVSRSTLSRWLKAADDAEAEDGPLARITPMRAVGR